MLLNKGADPNCHNKVNGNTPVHLAFEGGNAEIAKLLISYGGKLDERNYKGKTPPELSSRLDRKRIMSRLGSSKSSKLSSVHYPESFNRSGVGIGSVEKVRSDHCQEEINISDHNPLDEEEEGLKVYLSSHKDEGDENEEVDIDSNVEDKFFTFRSPKEDKQDEQNETEKSPEVHVDHQITTIEPARAKSPLKSRNDRLFRGAFTSESNTEFEVNEAGTFEVERHSETQIIEEEKFNTF